MVIDKPRHRGRSSFRGNRGRRPARRRERHQRSEAEQLDYDMELLRAQREGREDEFKKLEREKVQAKVAASLDAEMDDYFNSRPKKDASANDAQPTATADGDADAAAKPDVDLTDAAEKGVDTVSDTPSKPPTDEISPQQADTSAT